MKKIFVIPNTLTQQLVQETRNLWKNHREECMVMMILGAIQIILFVCSSQREVRRIVYAVMLAIIFLIVILVLLQSKKPGALSALAVYWIVWIFVIVATTHFFKLP